MAKLFGREYTKKELFGYSGNISNIAGVTKTELTEGKAKGTSVYEVRTGTGLEFNVVPDKCLDIAALRFGGITLSQQAKNGLTGPEYGQAVPGQFSRSVSGGMLFTSGLLNAGPESTEDDGTFHQCHGNIGVTPATDICAGGRWEGDEYIIEVSGTMRESALFGHNLLLHRTITTKLGSNELCIRDVLENVNFDAEEFCLLYHFNYGFPYLSEKLKLTFPENVCTPRTEEAKAGLAESDKVSAPISRFFEHVFFRDLTPDDSGWCTVKTENPELGIGSYISYEKKNLPNLSQWKSMRAGDYALGIEPCNMFIMGRREERINGSLLRIKPFEKLEFNLKLGVCKL